MVCFPSNICAVLKCNIWNLTLQTWPALAIVREYASVKASIIMHHCRGGGLVHPGEERVCMGKGELCDVWSNRATIPQKTSKHSLVYFNLKVPCTGQPPRDLEKLPHSRLSWLGNDGWSVTVMNRRVAVQTSQCPYWQHIDHFWFVILWEENKWEKARAQTTKGKGCSLIRRREKMQEPSVLAPCYVKLQHDAKEASEPLPFLLW